MGTTKLKLYNGALRELGESTISSLSANAERRRKLDTAYDNGFVDFVLSEGMWNFAKRSVSLDIDSAVSVEFGYSNAFQKPSDWIRTMKISGGEYFTTPLDAYEDEGDYIYADVDPLYLQFVSNGSSFGGDLSKWPANFILFAEQVLASRVCLSLTQSSALKDRLEKDIKKSRAKAKATDAMNEAVGRAPSGSWTLARRGGGVDRQRRSD